MAVDDSLTKILLHGDGTDGSTTFTDEGGSSWARNSNNIALDTDQKKFGTASFLASSGTDYLNLTGGLTTVINPGASPFTFDGWARYGAVPGQYGTNSTFFYLYNNADNWMQLSYYNNNTEPPSACYFRFEGKAGGVDLGVNYFPSTPANGAPVALDTWFHWELSRITGNCYRMFINGTAIGTTASKGSHTYVLSTGSMHLFQSDVQVWHDEFRYSKAVTRHTDNFVPEIAQYAQVSYSHNENCITPIMTANNAPSPVVITPWNTYGPPYEEVGNEAYRAFDRSGSTSFLTYTDIASLTVDLGEGNAKTVTSYTVTFGEDNTYWYLEGSNDNTNWTQLHKSDNFISTIDGKMRTYGIYSPGSYRYYRLRQSSSANGYLVVYELELIETPPPAGEHYEETIEDSLALTDELRYFTEEVDDTINLADRIPYFEEAIAEAVDLMDSFYLLYPLSIDEDLAFAEVPALQFKLPLSVDEGLDLAEGFTLQFPKSIDESLDLAEGFTATWIKSLNDNLAFADADIAAWVKSLAETLFIYEDALPSWLKSIDESLVLTDSQLVILGILISDWLTLKDSQSNNWHGTEVVPVELLNLYDLPYGARVINRSIAETLDVADTITIQWLVRILEHMQFTELLTAIGTFNHSAADTLTLTDEASRAFDQLIAEVLSLVDLSAVLTTFMPSLAESLGLADTSSSVRFIGKVISDAIGMTDAVGNNLHAYSIVQDAIALNVTVEMDGDVYECYVLNTPKFLPSVYSGFNFNSYCTFEGKAYGANSTGIYELGGETDAGAAINTGVVLSPTTFGIPNSKKLRRAWLGITGATPVLVLEVEGGTRKAYAIDSYGEVGSDRELNGKTWKLSIANFDELDFIKLLPVILAS